MFSIVSYGQDFEKCGRLITDEKIVTRQEILVQLIDDLMHSHAGSKEIEFDNFNIYDVILSTNLIASLSSSTATSIIIFRHLTETKNVEKMYELIMLNLSDANISYEVALATYKREIQKVRNRNTQLILQKIIENVSALKTSTDVCRKAK